MMETHLWKGGGRMPSRDSATVERARRIKGKDYPVDGEGFLSDPSRWDEGFAQGLAEEVGIEGELTDRHWEVIHFIRRFWMERGICPTIFQACRILGLHVAGFRFLFPAGYQRGACRLAGISYRSESHEDGSESPDLQRQSYRIDIWGFLLDPDEWDDRFALLKARETKLPGGLTNRHWEVIRFLREVFYRTRKVPTVFETCDALGIDENELETLFPDGYHRGAVKMAGLRVLQ